MFVDALVSSMNTSFLGSSPVCILRHALRAAATSGRSCSAACRLFFKGEIQMAKESEDRGLANDHLPLGQSRLKLGQREVRSRRNPSRNPFLMPFKSIAFISAKLRRTDTSASSPTRQKPAYRTYAHATKTGNLSIGMARLDRLHDAAAQVFRIRLPHPSWPPPSGKLESHFTIHGNPRFSLSAKRSKRKIHNPVLVAIDGHEISFSYRD